MSTLISLLNSLIDLNLGIPFELTLLLLHFDKITDYIVCCVGKLQLLLLILFSLALGGDEQKEAKFFIALQMHPVENPRRQA